MKMPHLQIRDSPTISFLKVISEKLEKCTDAREHVGMGTQTHTHTHTPCPVFKERFTHPQLTQALKQRYIYIYIQGGRLKMKGSELQLTWTQFKDKRRRPVIEQRHF